MCIRDSNYTVSTNTVQLQHLHHCCCSTHARFGRTATTNIFFSTLLVLIQGLSWAEPPPGPWPSPGLAPVTGLCPPVVVGPQISFYKKMKNVSCEYDRLNGWNSTLQAAWYIRHVCITWYVFFKKWKNVSCEIEGFVETHLCKLRGILRSRVLRVLCNLIKNVVLIEGDKIWLLWNSVNV